ncbi:MAG: ribosomal protein S6 [Candidatus Promineifilaceae bacterium]
MKTYDTMFILPTHMEQPDSDKLLESIQTEITRQEGTVLESDTPSRRSFARPMGKVYEGMYYRMRITMDPERIKDYKARLKLNTEIYRVQILVSDGKPFTRVAKPAEEDERGSRSTRTPRTTEPVTAPAKAPAAEKAADEGAAKEAVAKESVTAGESTDG